MSASSPVGVPVGLGYRHTQDRLVRKGDAVQLMIETNGPGGYYTQIGRTCVVGDIPLRMQDELELGLEAQRFCLGLMTPGARAADVWDAYNEFLRDHGRPEERRLHCHGQGYDLVERPLVRFDETMTIEAGMNVACHPGWLADDALAWICDGFLIGATGAERLHAYPQAIASA
jgi:Xaa-Pro aminopeptidase